MIEELEHKIMTKKRFAKAVEVLVNQKGFSYVDAMTYIIEERGMDYMNIKKLLSPSLKEKLTAEATRLNLVKAKKKNKLPV
jgi:2C-methyl-D-erythritol 2,4-cyclodiphosphate synthase